MFTHASMHNLFFKRKNHQLHRLNYRIPMQETCANKIFIQGLNRESIHKVNERCQMKI
jgi:hypothetical protein